ncbi:MAG: tetratricopeptide repeat protein, partial [Vicinamibacterales bacterium]
MRRSSAVTAVVSAIVAGIVLGWNTIGQDRSFRALIRDGDAALAAGDTSAAAAAFSGAMAIKPDSTVARVKRGDAYRRRGELQAALADLTAAGALDPSSTRARELLGDVYLALGQPARAVEAYRAYLALDERAPLVLVKLAGAELTDGEASAALASARRAIALDDRLAEAHYVEGLALRQRNPAQAARAFGRAVALKPVLIPAREQLGEVLLDLGRVKEAAEALDAIAALEPSNPGRAAAVVAAFSAAGKYDSAIRRLERAEDQFPGHAALEGARGLILLDRAEAEGDRPLRAEAEAVLAPLAARDRPSPAVLLGMGRARLLAGDPHGAVRWLERATANLPVDV